MNNKLNGVFSQNDLSKDDDVYITEPDYENNYIYTKTIGIAYVIFVISAGIGFICILIWKYFFKHKSENEPLNKKIQNGINKIKDDFNSINNGLV